MLFGHRLEIPDTRPHRYMIQRAGPGSRVAVFTWVLRPPTALARPGRQHRLHRCTALDVDLSGGLIVGLHFRGQHSHTEEVGG